MRANSGTYLFTYSPLGSNLCPNITGQAHSLESRRASKADDETHIQLPAQTDLGIIWSPLGKN